MFRQFFVVIVIFFWFCFYVSELVLVGMACYCWNGLLYEPTSCFLMFYLPLSYETLTS